MTGDCHVRFCERVKMKGFALLGQRQTVQKLKTDFINNFFRPAAYF